MKKIWFVILAFLSIVNINAQELPVYTDYRQLYDEGLELYDKNLFSAAHAKFNDFLLKTKEQNWIKPNSLVANARFYQATSAYFSGAPDAEERLIDFIEEYQEHSQVPFAQYCVGVAYFDRYKYKKALPYLNACAKSDLIKLKNEKVFSAKDRDKLIFSLGYCYMMEADDVNADNQFVRIKDKPGPYQEPALYYHSLISYKNEIYKDAYEGFSRLESSAQYGGKMPLLMANCLLMEKNYDGLQKLADRMSKDEPQVSFLAANAAYERRDYPKAVQMYDAYCAKTPKPDRVTLLRHGYSNYKLSKYKEAINPLEKASFGNSDSIAQAASYYLGFCFQKENRQDDALYAYKVAAQNTTAQNAEMAKDAAYQYAKLCFATQNYADAMTALTSLNEKYPDASFSEETKEMIAEIFSYSQNYEDAIPFFEKTNLVTNRAKSAYQSACFYYGLEHLKREQWEEADLYLSKAEANPFDEDLSLSAAFWLAEMQYKQNKFDAATGRYVEYMNKPGAKSHEMYPYAQFGLAWCNFNQKKYKDASVNFESFLKNSKKGGIPLNYQGDAYARLGDIEFLAKNYPKAIKNYEKVINEDLNGTEYALLQAGESYYRTNKYDQSITTFEKLITQYPQSELRDEALDRVSEIYYSWKKDLVKSEKYAQMLVKAYPRNPLAADAYNRLGLIAYERENTPMAITYFEKVINDYTYDTKNCNIALNNLSSIVTPNEFDNLLKEYKLKNPNSDSQLSDLTLKTAKDRYYLGSYGAAIELLTNFLSSNQKGKAMLEALYLRGESYRKTDQYSLALSDFEKVYSDPVQNEFAISALSSAASIKYDQSDFDGSINLYKLMQKEVQSQQEKTDLAFGFARSYMAKKEFTNALTSLEPIVNSESHEQDELMKARLWKGNCLYGMKKYEEAIALYQDVVNHNADDLGAEAQYMQVRTYFAKGLYEECVEAGKISKNNYMDSEWKDRAILWMAEASVELNNIFQAKNLFDEVAKSTPYPDIQKYAQDRLTALESGQ
ncbi:MAG: tetratricopeptide repeat protein [Bacteroidia bacterium]|nr:tetratricopeptide repeat protein [Bacteroidia bacterium]